MEENKSTYSKEEVDGNIMQLISEKVENSIKEQQELLCWLLSADQKHQELIPLVVESMQECRKDLYAKYGVHPVRLGEIK